MRIEQILHGYDNGHRMLAASVLLKDTREMELVAILSDWSEYVDGDNGDSSYVTAYPLKNSGFYVIAKTWYAGEMKRPGCVWTQSLLLPMSELNRIDDFRRIIDYFKRPSMEDGFEYYSHPIDFVNTYILQESYQKLGADGERVGNILTSLVQNAGPIYYKAGVESHPELILLSIMNVLPATILQRVSWCSGSAYVRKMNGHPLSCQFLTSNVEGGSFISLEAQPLWVKYMVFGIMRGDVNKGQLIRMFAEDIQENGANYAAVVSVLYTLEDFFKTNKTSEERYKEVLELIAESFPHVNDGKVIKKLCTNKFFSNRYCQDETFFYFFSTLSLDGVFDIEDTKINEKFNDFVTSNRSQYTSLLNKIVNAGTVNAWGKALLKDSADILTEEEVSQIVVNNNHLFNSISLLNPSILNKIKWSELKRNDVESVLPIIMDIRSQGVFADWDDLFKKLLGEGIEIRGSLASLIFVNGRNATSILLNYVNSNNNHFVGFELGKQLSKQISAILTWLESENAITVNVANAIVNAVDGHSNLVISRGAKVWQPFVGLEFQNLRAEVYAFMFSLSFNWPTNQTALELMRISFPPLYILQANESLRYEEWARISQYMEPLSFWEDWNKCKKMRKTVVKRLKQAGYSMNQLYQYTPDAEINKQLIRMW